MSTDYTKGPGNENEETPHQRRERERREKLNREYADQRGLPYPIPESENPADDNETDSGRHVAFDVNDDLVPEFRDDLRNILDADDSHESDDDEFQDTTNGSFTVDDDTHSDPFYDSDDSSEDLIEWKDDEDSEDDEYVEDNDRILDVDDSHIIDEATKADFVDDEEFEAEGLAHVSEEELAPFLSESDRKKNKNFTEKLWDGAVDLKNKGWEKTKKLAKDSIGASVAVGAAAVPVAYGYGQWIADGIAIGDPVSVLGFGGAAGAGGAIVDGIRIWRGSGNKSKATWAAQNGNDPEGIDETLKEKVDLINTPEEHAAVRIVERLGRLDIKNFPLFASEEDYAREVRHRILPVLSNVSDEFLNSSLTQKKLKIGGDLNEAYLQILGKGHHHEGHHEEHDDVHETKSHEIPSTGDETADAYAYLVAPEPTAASVENKKKKSTATAPAQHGHKDHTGHEAEKPLKKLTEAQIDEISVQLGRMMYTYHMKQGYIGRAMSVAGSVVASIASGTFVPGIVAAAYEGGRYIRTLARDSESHLIINKKGKIVNRADGKSKLTIPTEEEHHDDHDHRSKEELIEDLRDEKVKKEKAENRLNELVNKKKSIAKEQKKLNKAIEEIGDDIEAVTKKRDPTFLNDRELDKVDGFEREIRKLQRELRSLDTVDEEEITAAKEVVGTLEASCNELKNLIRKSGHDHHKEEKKSLTTRAFEFVTGSGVGQKVGNYTKDVAMRVAGGAAVGSLTCTLLSQVPLLRPILGSTTAIVVSGLLVGGRWAYQYVANRMTDGSVKTVTKSHDAHAAPAKKDDHKADTHH